VSDPILAAEATVDDALEAAPSVAGTATDALPMRNVSFRVPSRQGWKQVMGMADESCPLCGTPASKSTERAEPPVYCWACVECGTFRVGLARELWLRRASSTVRREEALRIRQTGSHGRIVLV
jgi:hypothetical protein